METRMIGTATAADGDVITVENPRGQPVMIYFEGEAGGHILKPRERRSFRARTRSVQDSSERLWWAPCGDFVPPDAARHQTVVLDFTEAELAPCAEIVWDELEHGVRCFGLDNGKARTEVEMTVERARELNAATCRCAAEASGFIAPQLSGPAKLPEGVSLFELLTAARVVALASSAERDKGGKSLDVVCDERIIAALYALERYQGSPTRLLEALGFTMKPTVQVGRRQRSGS